MSQLVTQIKWVIRIICALGVPYFTMTSQQQRHGFSHGQDEFTQGVLGEVILLVIFIYMSAEYGWYLWAILNLVAIIRYVYIKSKGHTIPL